MDDTDVDVVIWGILVIEMLLEVEVNIILPSRRRIFILCTVAVHGES